MLIWIVNNWGVCGLYSFCQEKGLVAGSCEQNTETSGGGSQGFLEQLKERSAAQISAN
jgi:hypothetical protein